MCFAAGVAAKAVLWLILFSVLQNQIFSFAGNCYDDCGGMQAKLKAERNGELLCASEDWSVVTTVCRMKCKGTKPDDDQLKCWKKQCARESLGFCEKPGMPSIYKDQCEEYLNEAKAKYYGVYCPDYLTYHSAPSENRTMDIRADNYWREKNDTSVN